MAKGRKMTIKGGSSLACAVCKFQRRKCKPDCLLAPYFPADQPRVFHNAHRLFGVGNMLKILEGIHPSQHAITMRTMIDEANMRAWYPVHGCLGVIHNLKAQIQMLEDEIRVVYSQLVIYRQMPAFGVTGDVAPPKTGPLLQNMPHQYNNAGIGESYDPDDEYVDGGIGDAIQVASMVLQPMKQEDYTVLHPFFDTESKSTGESSLLEDTKRSIKCEGGREGAEICSLLQSHERQLIAFGFPSGTDFGILPNIL